MSAPSCDIRMAATDGISVNISTGAGVRELRNTGRRPQPSTTALHHMTTSSQDELDRLLMQIELPMPSLPHTEPQSMDIDTTTLNTVLRRPLYGVNAAQLDIGAYIHRKRIKVRHQYSGAHGKDTTGISGVQPQSLFHGCVFWINGRTEPPMHALISLVYPHGGTVENVLVPIVTHVIADHLPATKIKEWKETKRHKRVIVRAQWIVDSVSAGRLLPVKDYRLSEFRDPTATTVTQYLISNTSTRVCTNTSTSTSDGNSNHSRGVSASASEIVKSNHTLQPSAHSPLSAQSPSTLPAATSHYVQSTTLMQPQQSNPTVEMPSVPGSAAAPTEVLVSSPISETSRALQVQQQQQQPHLHSPSTTEPAHLAQAQTTPAAAATATATSSASPNSRKHRPMSFKSLLGPRPSPPVSMPPAPPEYCNLMMSPPSLLSATALQQSARASSAGPTPPRADSSASSYRVQSVSTIPVGTRVSFESTSPINQKVITGTSEPLLTITVPDVITAPALTPMPTVDASKLPVLMPSTAATCISVSPTSALATDLRNVVAQSSVLLPSNMLDTVPSLSLPSGRSTLNDPQFVSTFFAASRLHFIGSWKRLFHQLIPKLLTIKPRFGNSDYHSNNVKQQWVLHADIDCFFASIAIRDNPALRGTPVAVSHSKSSLSNNPSTSSISSCNYEARAYGLRAEMSIGRALTMCPSLTVVPYEFDKYAIASEFVYRHFFSVTHCVQAVSLDEAYLLLPSTLTLAQVQSVCADIRQHVECTVGVCLSIGVSHSPLLARLATRQAKPNNLHYLNDDPQTLLPYMSGLGVTDLPGVGYKAERRILTELNVRTCGELQCVSKERLQSLLGAKTGLLLYDSCRGIDHRQLSYVSDSVGQQQQSLAVNVNYGIRMLDLAQVRHFLGDLSSELYHRLMDTTNLACQSITIKLMVRCPDAPIEPPKKFLGHGECDTRTRTKSIDGKSIGESPANDRERLIKLAWELFEKMRDEHSIDVRDLRGIGLAMGKLRKRLSANDRMQAFRAYGFTTIASDSDGDNEAKSASADEDPFDSEDANGADEAWNRPNEEVDDLALSQQSNHGNRADDATNATVVTTNDVSATLSPATAVTSAAATSPAPAAVSATISIPIQLPSTSGADPNAPVATATLSLPMDQLIKILHALGHTLQPLPNQAGSDSVSSNSTVPITVPSVDVVGISSGRVSRAAAAAASATTTNNTTATTTSGASTAATVNRTAETLQSIDDTVNEIDRQKEAQFLVALPPFSSLDRSIISALPFDIRQELALAYKKKRALDSQSAETVPMVSLAAPTVVAPTATATSAASRSSRAASPAPVIDLSFSQVDPSVMAELPLEIRSEIESQLRRNQPRPAPVSRVKPVQSSKASNRGRKKSMKTARPKSSPASTLSGHFNGRQRQAARMTDLGMKQKYAETIDDSDDDADADRQSKSRTTNTSVSVSLRQQRRLEGIERVRMQDVVADQHRSVALNQQHRRQVVDIDIEPPPHPIVTSTSTTSDHVGVGDSGDAMSLATATVFRSIRDLQPQFSEWLRALRDTAPRHRTQSHAHCRNEHCFCGNSANHSMLVSLCQTQLGLGNLECVHAIVMAIRRIVRESDADDEGGSEGAARCPCFRCGFQAVVASVNDLVYARYHARLIV